jgi:hypothetical protein
MFDAVSSDDLVHCDHWIMFDAVSSDDLVHCDHCITVNCCTSNLKTNDG